MPRDGAIIFGDLIGRSTCCGLRGRFSGICRRRTKTGRGRAGLAIAGPVLPPPFSIWSILEVGLWYGFRQREDQMHKLTICIGGFLLLAAYIAPVNAVPKMSVAECRTKVTNNPQYMQSGRGGMMCGRACNAAIKRCMQTGGKID